MAEQKQSDTSATDPDDLPDAAELLAKLQEGEEPVLVRIVEWKEWLPGSLTVLMSAAESSNGKDTKLPLHNGVSGFITGKNEKLVDLSVEGTGLTKVIEQTGEDGEKSHLIYGCYVFQAILVQNSKATAIEALLKAQEPPEADINDKSSSLTVIEAGQERQHKPTPKAKSKRPRR